MRFLAHPYFALVLLLAACGSPAPRQPVAAVGPLRGHYTFFAETGIFVECRSGEHLTVVAEGDNVALAAAYVRERRAPGVPVFATVQGRVEQRTEHDGGAPRRMLFVERFDSVSNAQGCSGPAQPDAPLVNTYWRLTMLGGAPLPPQPADAREPYLVLQGQQGVSGFSGCNRFSGSYTLEGERISFARLAATRMACMPEQSIEASFLDLLGKSARWRVMGTWLQLSASDGTVLALFEARWMR